MNAREWGLLVAGPRSWGRAAAALEAGSGGLEAVFDDAGRTGIAALLRGDERLWRTWTRALASDGLAVPRGPAPERVWAFFEAGRAAEAGAAGRLGDGPAAGTGEPSLDALLRDFRGLYPLSGLTLGPERLEARLAEAAGWPFFARCDIAKPFAARPAYWARRLGGRGVAGFALGRGRMEIFVQ